MKGKLWNGCKFILPIIILLYIIEIVRNSVENFWSIHLFYLIPPLNAGITRLIASAMLTFVSLFIIGYILEFNRTKHLLDAIAKHLPILRYFWSGEDNSLSYHRLTPVLFQHPQPGEWKIGFIMGEQKMDDGKEFYRVFFITGVGDHEFIEKERPDLLIPLSNPPPEIMQFVASFMASGPKILYRKT